MVWVLKLSGHVRNTIFLLYMQKTGWNSDILNFFNEKMDFFSILVYFHWNSTFESGHVWKRHCDVHTLTDSHDFGINGKRRPYPIPWYQTIILWACQFQVHEGVVTTPLGKPCYKKKSLVGRGLRLRISVLYEIVWYSSVVLYIIQTLLIIAVIFSQFQ